MTSESDYQGILSPIESRVVACLMEKQLTTPNNYPLSMNSLMLACNQKSNRVPVMNLTEGEIGHTVNQLEARGLVGVDYGGRATHVTHRVMTQFQINRKQQAVLAVLMVREPLTVNDIRTKTARMEEFDGIEDLKNIVESLINRDHPLVVCIPKGIGRREDRFTHLLCGKVDIEEMAPPPKIPSSNQNNRIEELEQRIEQLESKVSKLMELLD